MTAARRQALAVVAIVAVAVVGALAATLLSHPSPAGAQVTIPTLSTTSTAPPPSTTRPPASTTTEAPPPTTSPPPTEPATSVVTDTTLVTDTTVAGAETTLPPATTVAPSTTPTTAAAPATEITAAVTGSYGVVSTSVLLFAAVLVGLSTFARSVRVQPSRGGAPVTDSTRRWRLVAGFACLAVAAIVGIVGYLKLSLEPQVNRQIPYLASAGMALVVLSALGGSLVVGEQLKADTRRIEQLEDAVARLAEIVAPEVEQPARRAPRRAASGQRPA